MNRIHKIKTEKKNFFTFLYVVTRFEFVNMTTQSKKKRFQSVDFI